MPKNILIIRNDKLGDFMLAWPSFQAVKQLFPDATIYALVPEYTRPMAELCPWIDEIVLDEDRDGILGITKTTFRIKKLDIDAALCLHSSPRIALALFLAGISHRFAPASRIDQILYNHTLKQRRSRSEKPEYEYNTDLALFMGQHYGVDSKYTLKPPLLSFSDQEIQEVKDHFHSEHNINKDKKLIFVHAGSGGSASNLSIEQYVELIKHLSNNPSLFFVLTAGPGELDTVTELSKKINSTSHTIYNSTKGIVEFSKILCMSDVFISGSTGPLHLVTAANKNTAAFYPAHRSATSLRWQTVNAEPHRLSFTHDINEDMSSINAKDAAREISNKFLQ